MNTFFIFITRLIEANVKIDGCEPLEDNDIKEFRLIHSSMTCMFRSALFLRNWLIKKFVALSNNVEDK